jgi:hypothetical protein
MAKFLWAIVCDRAIVSTRNTVTLVDLLEDMQMPQPPDELVAEGKPQLMIPMRFAVVSLWDRATPDEASRSTARMRFVAPTGKMLGETSFQVDLKTYSRFRATAESPALPYFGPGEYKFKFDLRVGDRWRPVGSTHFNLRVTAPKRVQ